MRIHWKRPRCKLAYIALILFVSTMVILLVSRRTDYDCPGCRKDSDMDSQELGRVIRNVGNGFNDEENGLDHVGNNFDLDNLQNQGGDDFDDLRNDLNQENELSNQMQGPGEYSGPFPDSKVAEGVQSQLIDYHNYTQQQLDKARTGLGEHGKSAKVPASSKQEEDRLYLANGFNGLLSDLIALDRALPDTRDPTCGSYRYYKELPTVSIVIPFFEEQLSALKRTVVSVINRSPKHLIKEIILVDDGSTTRPDLNYPLERWLETEAPVGRVVRLSERQGLIAARMAGAREALGDVILILDSHCEVMVNWLPPLLSPIADNYRTAVCPLIDVIKWNTFSYTIQDNGAKGGFDWHFYYKRIPLSTEETAKLPAPYPNPVMNGGLFAMSRQFFFELGGYDPGVQIWGGEQYNLSFKVWQCGGRMLDVPCSRVGHVFRGTHTNRPIAKQQNYLSKNYKRVALVWMDEYIEALYKKMPELRSLNAGDITGELAIKERLQCKSFKWFLENIATDMVKIYPPFPDPDFANGTLRNVESGQCLDTGGRTVGDPIQHPCNGGSNQKFAWCWRETIRIPNEQFCLEAAPSSGRGPTLYNCNNASPPSKQKWKYNPYTKMLMDTAKNQCLEVAPSQKLMMATCSPGLSKQQWDFKNINFDRIKQVFPEMS
uniref:Polypeptide N-acetylgalactosaminyltransferase n=1 Tax=Hirondellea gigas TaxID=1518452 RepID=A0A6A7FN03_9CRUS